LISENEEIIGHLYGKLYKICCQTVEDSCYLDEFPLLPGSWIRVRSLCRSPTPLTPVTTTAAAGVGVTSANSSYSNVSHSSSYLATPSVTYTSSNTCSDIPCIGFIAEKTSIGILPVYFRYVL